MAKIENFVLSSQIEHLQERRVDYTKYEKSFRRWIVSEVEGKRMSKEDVIRNFNLDSKFYLAYKDWRRDCAIQLGLTIYDMKNKNSETPSYSSLSKDELIKRLSELETEHEDLLKKNNYKDMQVVALNTLIDVAEQEFKIKIRKKPGSK